MKDREALEAELRHSHEESSRLRAENLRLRRENARRQARLGPAPRDGHTALQLPLPNAATSATVTNTSPAAEKVALFRRLFRGREDVYAVRWERRDGRAGYAPASRSRTDREQGLFLPLTDAVLQGHLSGRRTIGVYPLLRDDTCWFLAVDFDKEHWQEDVSVYLEACDALGVPAALERSRSGNGGHVWIFFDAPVAAAQARRLGSALLTRALADRRQIGLDSYDRLFPNQDTLPRGGFGNLIALPLQGIPRQGDNSVFLERSFTPYADQWAFLSSVRHMSPEELDRMVAVLTREGGVIGVKPSYVDLEDGQDPWTLPPSGKRLETRVAGPFPPSVHFTLSNLVYVGKEGLPPALLSRLWRLAAFQNPEFYRAQKMRLSTFGKPPVVSCAEEFQRHIGLPRGCLDDARDLLEAHGIDVHLGGQREAGTAGDCH